LATASGPYIARGSATSLTAWVRAARRADAFERLARFLALALRLYAANPALATRPLFASLITFRLCFVACPKWRTLVAGWRYLLAWHHETPDTDALNVNPATFVMLAGSWYEPLTRAGVEYDPSRTTHGVPVSDVPPPLMFCPDSEMVGNVGTSLTQIWVTVIFMPPGMSATHISQHASAPLGWAIVYVPFIAGLNSVWSKD
jgi:hypothetical protein